MDYTDEEMDDIVEEVLEPVQDLDPITAEIAMAVAYFSTAAKNAIANGFYSETELSFHVMVTLEKYFIDSKDQITKWIAEAEDKKRRQQRRHS